MRRLTPILLLTAILLAGCSPAPSQEEIEEAFAIEAASTIPGADKDDPAIRDLAAALGENADEDCNNTNLWRLATTGVDEVRWEPDLQYIHAAACLVLYGDALEDSLHEDYSRVVFERVVNDAG